MALNKIKLKQIDADFPALVGQYGSGYFASTGSLHGLSGQSVKYSDLATGAFVYTTGSQNISGYKNFLSRSAISGVGIATLSEIVSIDGNNAIFGENTFYEKTIFLSGSKFQNNLVEFENSSFTVDETSLDNLTNSLTKLVKTTGDQIVLGVKTFRSGIKVGSGGGSGVLYSGQINPVYVSGVTGNSNRYLTFVENTGNGFKNMQMHTGFSYNPSTQTLKASTFEGSVSGNALNATTSADLNVSTFTSEAKISFNFPVGTPNYIMTMGAFYATPATGDNITARNLGLANNGWNNLYVGAAPILASDKNLKTEVSEIPDSWLDAWQEVDYVKYKFKDAVAQKGLSGARWHVGHIAQDIYDKFNTHNLNAFDIGMLCYDKWDESSDENGNITPSGEIWSIRPDECQFMEMALMRRSINRLKSGVSL